MAHYFFDTGDGTSSLRDEVGSELPDDQAARVEAIKTLAEIVKDYLPSWPPQAHMVMWVRNDRGESIWRLAFNFSIEPMFEASGP